MIATQALSERSYGYLGLALMHDGKTAAEALNGLLSIDRKREYRQVSMIDHQGTLATHTGRHCFPEAGSCAGENYCAQANMVEKSAVWKAMAKAYEMTEGRLEDRLLAALDAAQGEGGDLRGQQTAALLVVDEDRKPVPLIDLRVDHSRTPLKELHRLLHLHRAYEAARKINDCIETGDHESAYNLLRQVSDSAKTEPYLQYLCAMYLAGYLNRWEEAVQAMKSLVQASPVWKEYLRRERESDNFGCPGLGARLLRALEI